MREIEFRFWHLSENKMIDWVWITQNAWNSYRGETPISLLFDFLTVKKSEVIILQFTGLKDKNGKKIYEGDFIKGICILTDSNGYDNYVKIEGLVNYSNEYSAFSFTNNIKTPLENYCNFMYQLSEIEVVGNIYENENLLNV